MSVALSRTSREYVYIPDVVAFRDGVVADITTLPVDVAAIPFDTTPVATDWVAAQWTPGASTPTIRVLVGPGGTLIPPPGTWALWARVLGAVEQPEQQIDTLVIL